MSYALTVGVCSKYLMAQKILRSSVQKTTVNKDYDTSDISPYVGYNHTMKDILTDPALLYIYWVYGMIGLSAFMICLSVYEYFKK